MVLSAAAAQTTRIRLTSTLTVLSSADPVRVFEDFATMDLISSGRAEITAGRSAYIESFPLCGQELERYDEYFEDRLDLLLKIRDQNTVSWRGTTRAALDQLGVWPRGALFAGSPNEIVEKILWEHDVLGHARFLAPVRLGGLPQAQTLKSIELLATEVMPKACTALA